MKATIIGIVFSMLFLFCMLYGVTVVKAGHITFWLGEFFFGIMVQ